MKPLPSYKQNLNTNPAKLQSGFLVVIAYLIYINTTWNLLLNNITQFPLPPLELYISRIREHVVLLSDLFHFILGLGFVHLDSCIYSSF